MSVNWIVRRAIARWLRRSRWELDDTLIVCCHLVSPYSHSKRICLKPLMTLVTLAPSFSIKAMMSRWCFFVLTARASLETALPCQRR